MLLEEVTEALLGKLEEDGAEFQRVVFEAAADLLVC